MCGCAYHPGPGDLETMGRELLEASVPGLGPPRPGKPPVKCMSHCFPSSQQSLPSEKCPIGAAGILQRRPTRTTFSKGPQPGQHRRRHHARRGPIVSPGLKPLARAGTPPSKHSSQQSRLPPPPSPASEKPLLDPVSGQKDRA